MNWIFYFVALQGIRSLPPYPLAMTVQTPEMRRNRISLYCYYSSISAPLPFFQSPMNFLVGLEMPLCLSILSENDLSAHL
jgi:hypothetical protein